VKTIAFFNSVAGVGKTTLVYHLAWMMADRGDKVLVVDLDPQANLSRMFLSDDRLESLWSSQAHSGTIVGGLQRTALEAIPYVEGITATLGLVVGDLALSRFDETLAEAWSRSASGDRAALLTSTAIHRAIRAAARLFSANWVLVDLGPTLGALNRSVLLASEHVVIPLRADLFSFHGLRSLGPALASWRKCWETLAAGSSLELPEGRIDPLGYVVTQPGTRAEAYRRWVEQLPIIYRESVLQQPASYFPSAALDPSCLAVLKHYRSLMPMAMEARKPVFFLKPADGAIGAHIDAVRSAYRDFYVLATEIAARTGAALPR
jgi:cellulose biosynthesis protein BcsQ